MEVCPDCSKTTDSAAPLPERAYGWCGHVQERHGAFATKPEGIAQLGVGDRREVILCARGGGLTDPMKEPQRLRSDGSLCEQRCDIQRTAWSQLGAQDTEHLGGIVKQMQKPVAGHRRKRARLERKVEQSAWIKATRLGSTLTRWAARLSMPRERSTRTKGRLVDR